MKNVTLILTALILSACEVPPEFRNTTPAAAANAQGEVAVAAPTPTVTPPASDEPTPSPSAMPSLLDGNYHLAYTKCGAVITDPGVPQDIQIDFQTLRVYTITAGCAGMKRTINYDISYGEDFISDPNNTLVYSTPGTCALPYVSHTGRGDVVRTPFAFDGSTLIFFSTTNCDSAGHKTLTYYHKF